MAKEKPSAGGRKDPAEIYFDQALENHGMPAREDDESLEDYVGRKTWGKNTAGHLENARQAAENLDRVQTIASIHSARQHHDDPNPPDSKPLKP